MVERAATEAGQATLHQRIRAELEQQILSGELAPGDRIPFEHELVARYGCSRMTVNKVLTALADAGLIERRRRAGSFVRRPGSLPAVLRVQDVRTDIEERGESYGYDLIDREERQATVADRRELGVGRGTPVLAVTCLHSGGRRPFAFERRVLNLSAVPEIRDADLARQSAGAWLLAHVPWTEAEHRIAAAPADAAAAEALGLPPGAPVLEVRRRTFRGGQTITAVRLAYPAGRHELVARFTP